jgi:hypothetical protein
MSPQRARRIEHAIATGVAALLLAQSATVVAHAQGVPLEYQVKAVYLFNFVKYVTWPAPARPGPIRICLAERNPFGDALEEALRGETVDKRPLEVRVIDQPVRGCDVLFVPRGTVAKPYLQSARGSSTLSVGEQPGFLAEGGIINFIIETGSVRFEIDADAAERARLRISSHLLRLARETTGQAE